MDDNNNLYLLKKPPKTEKPRKLCDHKKYCQIVTGMIVTDLDILMMQIEVMRSGLAALISEELECKHRETIARKAIKIRLTKMAMIGQNMHYLRGQLEAELIHYKMMIEVID